MQEINQPITKCNIDKVVNELHDILYSCTEQQQKPKSNNSKRRPNRKHKWTPEIHKAMKRSKNQFAKWKAANRPRDPDNPTYQDMKQCRKTLRSMQRQHEAQLRYNRYEEIMELQQNNNNGFYSIIRKQRDTKSISGSIINFKNVQVSNDDEILLGWADYFKDLAMPEFDKAFLQPAENDVKNLYNLYTNDRQETLKKVSIDEIATTVKSLKNGKSPDERHISAEHLKYGGRKLLEYLTVLVNWIFENLQIPKTLKSGIACPILKKGKPAHDPNSYRKITITSLIGKVIEKIHLTRNSNAITEQQNKLQKGFTQGEMPIIAALILSELIAEAKSSDIYGCS